MSDEPKLLPCPFCGGKAILNRGPLPDRWGTYCVGCEVWRDDRCVTPELAAERWNERPDPAPQLAAEVLELREALQPFASAWNIAHASGNQNLGQLGAIARNEVSAHYFIKAAAALSPAPVMDAVKQGDA